MRELEIAHHQQQHLAELQRLQQLAQLPRTHRRNRLAQLLRTVADLLEGRARIALVYQEALPS